MLQNFRGKPAAWHALTKDNIESEQDMHAVKKLPKSKSIRPTSFDTILLPSPSVLPPPARVLYLAAVPPSIRILPGTCAP